MRTLHDDPDNCPTDDCPLKAAYCPYGCADQCKWLHHEATMSVERLREDGMEHLHTAHDYLSMAEKRAARAAAKNADG